MRRKCDKDQGLGCPKLASSPPPHFRRSASPSPSVSHSCVFLVFWRQKIVKTVGAGTTTSKHGSSCRPSTYGKRNKHTQKHVFFSKDRLFQKRPADNFREPTYSRFFGFWQAIWRTPKIKRPSFGAKSIGYSENTCFYSSIFALFRKSVFFEF